MTSNPALITQTPVKSPRTNPANLDSPETLPRSCMKEAQASGADARAEPHVRWAARPLMARESGVIDSN